MDCQETQDITAGAAEDTLGQPPVQQLESRIRIAWWLLLLQLLSVARTTWWNLHLEWVLGFLTRSLRGFLFPNPFARKRKLFGDVSLVPVGFPRLWAPLTWNWGFNRKWKQGNLLHFCYLSLEVSSLFTFFVFLKVLYYFYWIISGVFSVLRGRNCKKYLCNLVLEQELILIFKKEVSLVLSILVSSILWAILQLCSNWFNPTPLPLFSKLSNFTALYYDTVIISLLMIYIPVFGLSGFIISFFISN